MITSIYLASHLPLLRRRPLEAQNRKRFSLTMLSPQVNFATPTMMMPATMAKRPFDTRLARLTSIAARAGCAFEVHVCSLLPLFDFTARLGAIRHLYYCRRYFAMMDAALLLHYDADFTSATIPLMRGYVYISA